MARPFTIKPAAETIELDRERGSEVVFTVSNASGRPINARGRIAAADPAQKAWFKLLDEPERKLKVDETTQYKVKISVPPNAAAGSYKLQFDVVEVDNEESFTEGSPVGFQVKGAAAPTPKKFPWWIVAAAAGVLVLVGGGIGIWMAMSGGDSGKMADLVGKELDEAIKWINDEGLHVNLVADRQNPKDANHVRSQDPKAGEKVTKDETIVSLVYEPPFVDVPDLKGRKADEATTALHKLGLGVSVTLQTKDSSKAGMVVSQDPAPGPKKLQGGDTVKLVAEKGSIEMPDVTFKTVEEAKKALAELKLTNVKVMAADLFPAAMDSNAGKIGFQSQPAGTPVSEDTPIQLTPIGAAVKVPRVKTGMKYEDAAKVIEAVKLKAAATAETPTDEEKAKNLANTVKRTVPGADERALEGSTVAVVVVGGGTIKVNPKLLEQIGVRSSPTGPLKTGRLPIKNQ
jgi:beta-lactam-binding protein with PASTA domain